MISDKKLSQQNIQCITSDETKLEILKVTTHHVHKSQYFQHFKIILCKSFLSFIKLCNISTFKESMCKGKSNQN